jgi:adenylate cyclase
MAERGDRALEDGIQALSDWIVAEGLQTAEFEPLFAGFCDRLAALGVPVLRGHVAMRTLHPEIRAMGYSWRPGAAIESSAMNYSQESSAAFIGSPFKWLIESGQGAMRRSLAPDADLEFPLLGRFRDEGATDYYARVIGFGFGRDVLQEGLITSWTTAREGGFGETDIAVLDRLLPRLALALKSTIAFQFSVNLLDVYVGGDAGRRILRGTIRRGSTEVISAVVFFADLQGFTAAADAAPGDAVVGMLNDYFDCLVPPVVARGGQVLKFIGDGLLAVFALDAEQGDECTRALTAAREALERTRALNERRAASGRPYLPLHIALHTGDVHYGNIGSSGRLDFTVIGPAVNEASRIEALCGETGHALLVSERFAQDPACRGALRPVGEFALRGVPRTQTLYTVAEG